MRTTTSSTPSQLKSEDEDTGPVSERTRSRRTVGESQQDDDSENEDEDQFWVEIPLESNDEEEDSNGEIANAAKLQNYSRRILRAAWVAKIETLSTAFQQGEISEVEIINALYAESTIFGDGLDTDIPNYNVRVLDLPPEPRSLKEALSSPYASKWIAAIFKEYNMLKEKKVWQEVPRPLDDEGRKVHVMTCKWVFAYKANSDGLLQKFKARLVARGFTQKIGKDYDKIFSPVVKIQSMRMIIAAAFLAGFHMHVFDIDVAYLNGIMDKETYMTMPPGFERTDASGFEFVCRLIHSLYGTKQAGRMWYIFLIRFLQSIGFSVISADHCVLILKGSASPNGKAALITIYVDDCMLTSSSLELIESIKEKFRKEFGIKDQGEAKWLLKLQLERRRENDVEVLWIGQPLYAEKLVKEFSAWLPKTQRLIGVPMIVSWKHDDESPKLTESEKSIYRSIIASMSYLAQQTRLDIMFAVNHLAQYSQDPRECDKVAAMRILGYLKENPDLGPTYFRTTEVQGAMTSFLSETEVELDKDDAPQGAADASWGTERNYKSRTGIIFRFAGGPVTWYSGKQAPTAVSSAEAELYALSDAAKEAKFIRDVFQEIGIKHTGPTVLLEDNRSAIQIAEDPKHHARVKHLGIRLGFLRELIASGVITAKWCPTGQMWADCLTKALPFAEHWLAMNRMGMRKLSNLGPTDVIP